MKHKLTDAQKTARVEKRQTLRRQARAKKAAMESWRETSRISAMKRLRTKAEARRKAQAGKRGVDRVPASILSAPSVTVEPYQPNPDHPKGPRQIGGELGISTLPDGRRIQGNHAQRRAYGARGHQRKPRRRELPAAQARREKRRDATQ